VFLVIQAARLFIRELHSVIGDKWGGKVRMSPHPAIPAMVDKGTGSIQREANGKPIQRRVETAYMHSDISDYGWGAVLNIRKEAREP
jgi:hypothetical protein